MAVTFLEDSRQEVLQFESVDLFIGTGQVEKHLLLLHVRQLLHRLCRRPTTERTKPCFDFYVLTL